MQFPTDTVSANVFSVVTVEVMTMLRGAGAVIVAGLKPPVEVQLAKVGTPGMNGLRPSVLFFTVPRSVDEAQVTVIPNFSEIVSCASGM